VHLISTTGKFNVLVDEKDVATPLGFRLVFFDTSCQKKKNQMKETNIILSPEQYVILNERKASSIKVGLTKESFCVST